MIKNEMKKCKYCQVSVMSVSLGLMEEEIFLYLSLND